MGVAVGRRLHEAGARILVSMSGRSASSADRARRAVLKVAYLEGLLTASTTFYRLFRPGQRRRSRNVCVLRNAASPALFVDCNAIAPTTMHDIAQQLDPLLVIAAGISGDRRLGAHSLRPPDRASTPPGHMRIGSARSLVTASISPLMDAPIGAASGLKLSYAGLTKGFTALAAAIVTAATRDGLGEAWRIELARTQPEFLERIDRFASLTRLRSPSS